MIDPQRRPTSSSAAPLHPEASGTRRRSSPAVALRCAASDAAPTLRPLRGRPSPSPHGDRSGPAASPARAPVQTDRLAAREGFARLAGEGRLLTIPAGSRRPSPSDMLPRPGIDLVARSPGARHPRPLDDKVPAGPDEKLACRPFALRAPAADRRDADSVDTIVVACSHRRALLHLAATMAGEEEAARRGSPWWCRSPDPIRRLSDRGPTRRAALALHYLRMPSPWPDHGEWPTVQRRAQDRLEAVVGADASLARDWWSTTPAPLFNPVAEPQPHPAMLYPGSAHEAIKFGRARHRHPSNNRRAMDDGLTLAPRYNGTFPGCAPTRSASCRLPASTPSRRRRVVHRHRRERSAHPAVLEVAAARRASIRPVRLKPTR